MLYGASDTHIVTVKWGDGSEEVSNGSGTFTHTYVDDGNYIVNAAVTDNDGTTTTASDAISITDLAPSVTVAGNGTVNDEALFRLEITPVGDGTYDKLGHYTVDWGDSHRGTILETGLIDSSTFDGEGAFIRTHTYFGVGS